MFPLRLFAIITAIHGMLASAAAQEGLRGVHDPCIAKCGDHFYVLSTGRGIPLRRSSDLRNWERAGSVFPALPEWVRREYPRTDSLWAPDIVLINGTYHLYYSVSSFGSNVSAIGLATNPTLDPDSQNYSWEDQGIVIKSTQADDWNAIDPNIAFDRDGNPWLSFGSFWSGIKLCRLDARTGKRPEADDALLSIASRPGCTAIEAPFIVRKGEFFYLFVSFDRCCRGIDSTYRIMVGRSQEITGPYGDRRGEALESGGATPVLAGYGRFQGPGHCAVLHEGEQDWLVHHFYDREANGVPTLQLRPLSWADGWPVAGEPLVVPSLSSGTQSGRRPPAADPPERP